MKQTILILLVLVMVGCGKKDKPLQKGVVRRVEREPEKPSLEIPAPDRECPEEDGIIYFSGRRRGIGLFRMSVDGSEVKNIRLGGGPVVSPDGTKLAYTQFYNDTNRFEVAVSRIDGGGIIRLTKDSERDSKNPAWSPDGSKFAFQTGPNNTPDIAMMNSDGSGIKILTKDPEADSSPTWSPDGKQIAGGFKEGVTPLETNEQRQQIFQDLVTRVAKRRIFDYNLGRVKYSSSRREKVVMLSFPIDDSVLMVTAEPHVNIDRLAFRIIDKIGSQWGEFFGK